MSVKRLTLLKRFIAENDLELIDHGTEGTRWYANVRARNGQTAKFTMPKKEGDIRGDLNESARIKRFAVANNGTPDLTGVPETTEKDIEVVVRRKLTMVDLKTGNQETLDKAAAQLDAPTPLASTAAPPAEAASPPAKPKRTIARVTQAQFYKLVEFIKPVDTLKFFDHQALADFCTEQLGFPVARTSVREALEILGKTTQYQQQRADASHRNEAQVVTIAKALCGLFEHLGEKVPEDLRRIIR